MIKKAGKYRYGYKKYYVTDNEGLVLGVATTKASTSEIDSLEEVLDTRKRSIKSRQEVSIKEK
ncbi:transposase [Tenacibaculum maritimum]|uniref:transposase n=1 Tax=Tenacibaculum maritimum TaxID=107401 RepID=UPI00132F6D89|nr:transposase [Tenacibaculum maritimum]